MAEKNSMLLSCFCEFYKEIVELKHTAMQMDRGDLTAQDTSESSEDTADVSEKQQVYLMNRKVTEYLESEHQRIKESYSASEVAAFYKAMYIMASLADELFILKLDWTGKEHWQEFPVEETLFQSCISGTKFFSDIDDLIQKNQKDELNKDLASVYLLAIRLGFSGRFDDKKGQKRLNKYSGDLLNFIGTGTGKGRLKPLFPDAWKYTRSNAVDMRVGSLRPWIKYFVAGLITFYLIIFRIVWEITILPLTELF